MKTDRILPQLSRHKCGTRLSHPKVDCTTRWPAYTKNVKFPSHLACTRRLPGQGGSCTIPP